MSMTSLPIVSALRERLQWHQTRQKVLAENVANADTPGFRPRELVDPGRSGGAAVAAPAGLPLAQTSPLHLALQASSSEAGTKGAVRFETRPSGNAVSLEGEMMKVAENQSDYQLAATLYQKSLALLKTAVGRAGA